MLRHKTIIWLLFIYLIFQLGTLFTGVGFFMFVYVIAYIVAIIDSAIKSSIGLTREASIAVTIYSLTWFFLINLILYLIYLPTLIYNPEINWKLKGEIEQDPMILQAYVPIVFFIVAAAIISLTALLTKLVLRYRKKAMLKSHRKTM